MYKLLLLFFLYTSASAHSIKKGIGMQSSIFKVYDIRGIVGSELLVENMYQLAQAIAFYYKENFPTLTTVAIGRDGRASSPAIFHEVSQAFVDSGINVIDIGIAPTPIMYFAQYKLPVQGGLMITASHNPPEYNGIKLMLNKESIYGEEIQRLYRYYMQKRSIINVPKGTILKHNLCEDYVYFLLEQFPHLIGSDIRAIIDCANGATGSILPLLKKKFEWDNVQLIYETVSGYPDHQADPTKEKNVAALKTALLSYPEAIGIAFDGDGDRMNAVTEKNILLQGDELGSIFARNIRKKEKTCTIVTDVSYSHVLLQWLEDEGIRCITSKVGHSFIKEAMHKNNAVFGAEISCHFCFADHYFGYDDGIYAMMRLFSLLIASEQMLHVHHEKLPARANCSLRIPYEPTKKDLIINDVKTHFEMIPASHISTLDGICAELPYGWGLIRASNTEPVLSLRFESCNETQLHHIKKDFYTILRKHFDAHLLKEEFDLY